MGINKWFSFFFLCQKKKINQKFEHLGKHTAEITKEIVCPKMLPWQDLQGPSYLWTAASSQQSLSGSHSQMGEHHSPIKVRLLPVPQKDLFFHIVH